ncbi:7479_t:CDS:2, partial [Diversispora eburnea]
SHFNAKRLEKDNSDISEDEFDNEQGSSNKSKNIPKLSNIKLIYLPPNTTAHLQPMDAGIIHSFKAKYKQEFCRHLIQQFDSEIDHIKTNYQFIQSEENEESDSDEEEEILLVLVKDAVSELETFIKYFEQQDNNSEFNVDDL